MPDIIEQQIKFTSDEGSARRVVEDTEDIARSAEHVTEALRAADNVGLDGIVTEANRASTAVEGLDRELTDLDGKKVRVDIDVNEDRLRRRLDTVDRVGTIGSQVAGGLGNSELGNVAGLVGDLATAGSTLNPVLIGATAAMAGVAVVGNLVTQRLEEMAEQGRNAATGISQAIDALVAGASLDDLEAQISADEDRVRLREDRITAINEAIAGVGATMAQQSEILLQIGQDGLAEREQTLRDLFGGIEIGVSGAQAAVAQLQGEVNTLKTNIAVNQALLASDPIQEEFAEKIEIITADFRDGTLAIDEVSESWAQFAEDAELAADAADAAAAAQQRLAQSAKAISTRIFEGQQQQADAAADAATEWSEQLLDAVENVTETTADVAKAENDLNTARQKGQARLADLIAQSLEKQADLYTDYNTQRLDDLEDFEDRREEIQRRALKATGDAIASRDSLAYAMAQDAAAEDTRREEQQTDKDARRDERNYQRQVQQAERANQRLLNTEQQRQNDELTIKRAALVAARADLTNAQYAERAIRNQGYIQNITDAATAGYQIAKVLLNSIQQAINAGSPNLSLRGERYGDWRSGQQGMTQAQVDRQIENAFRQVFA